MRVGTNRGTTVAVSKSSFNLEHGTMVFVVSVLLSCLY